MPVADANEQAILDKRSAWHILHVLITTSTSLSALESPIDSANCCHRPFGDTGVEVQRY